VFLLLLPLQADPKVTSMYDAKLVRPELTVSQEQQHSTEEQIHEDAGTADCMMRAYERLDIKNLHQWSQYSRSQYSA
jgi:hypothetical protein